MSSYSSKRPGGDSPDTRPTKRTMTSSPEEGELDDSTPPPPVHSSLPSPARNRSLSKSTKVPFPFKKKVAAQERPEHLPDRPGPPGYHEDERRFRDEDSRRPPYERFPRGRSNDHWAPPAVNYDGRPPPPPPPRRPWEDDRSYRPRPELERWEPRDSPGLVSPRFRRRSRSPSSPRSRSPLSPESTGKEKHRLPRPTALEPDNRSLYDDEERSWGRSRDSRQRSRRSPHGWVADSYVPEDDDRYRRPRLDTRDSYVPHDYEDDYLRRPTLDERRTFEPPIRRGLDSYHPLSPRTPPRPLSPQSLRDTIGRATPPPGSPNETRASQEDQKDEALPTAHIAVKISLPKKPQSPKANAVPISLLDGRKPIESAAVQPPSSNGAAQKLAAQRRRKPIQRSRDEERAVYGRIFEGCGLQSDYDVITKLGEGTFGYVLLR